MIHQILAPENLKSACSHLQKKGDSFGVDGMRLSQLPEYLENNSSALINSIMDLSFRPGLVQEISYVDKKGKVRNISKFNSIDRMLLRAIHQILYPHLVSKFSKYSYVYFEGKSVMDAVRQAALYIESGKTFTVDVDVEKFFDNISHHKLMELLSFHGLDKITKNLLSKFIKCKIVRDFEIKQKEKGLVQGSPLSPLLSNLYLHEADSFFHDKGYSFCRYADDIKLFVSSYEEGLEQLHDVKQFLEKELMLNIHPKKSGVFPAIDRPYLGYQFYEFPNGKIEIKKKTLKARTNIYNWKATALQKINGEYHIFADGILTQKDFSLLFENPEKKVHLPVMNTECLSIYSDIEYSVLS
ncbi:MAG: Retron-type reverse transcriptase [Clostridiaceae bacterium]|nr:Retron-type reverse transcriptase [Clostridiaceae bacterium]